MAGMLPNDDSTVPDSWLQAWRTRQENPIVMYGETIMARSRLSTSIFRRHAFSILVGIGSLVLYFLAFLFDSPGSVGEFILQLLLGMLAVFLIVLVAFFLESIFQLIVRATALLAIKPQRDGELQLDSMLAGTGLSDRELLVGFLSLLLKPLKIPVILLAISAAFAPLLFVVFDWIINGSMYDALPLMALTAPITGLAVGACSMASLMILALWFIITGYRSRFALAGPLAGISYCGGQAILALVLPASQEVLFFSLQELSTYAASILTLLLLSGVAATGWLAGAVALGCYLAQRWPGFGIAYALLLPLALPGNLILTGIILVLANEPDLTFALTSAQFFSWLALVPINPLTTPTPMSYGIPDGLATLPPGILVFAGTVFVQLVLIAILQAFARSAVRARRSSFSA
jgi:hypothetical protein